jgi:hypothetical protein
MQSPIAAWTTRILLILGLGLGFAAQAASAQTAQEQASIEQALQRGRLMFGIDRAAWVATDDMVARIRDLQASGIRGYIVEPQPDGFDVIFYAASGNDLVQAYRGRVGRRGVASREVFPAASRPPLTAAQRRMVAAVNAAAGSGRRPCGNQRFNPLIIPPASAEAPIDVYLMTPQTAQGIPFGGHFRVTVAPDGNVASSRAFTNSCLVMPRPPANAAGLMVSHLLDPVPTEVHIFSSLAAGVPVFVATSNPDRLWEVTGERVRLVPNRR